MTEFKTTIDCVCCIHTHKKFRLVSDSDDEIEENEE